MIAIINRGGEQTGVCRYTVGINELVVAEFEHNRMHGLAKCLELAAEAVRVEEARQWARVAGYFDQA